MAAELNSEQLLDFYNLGGVQTPPQDIINKQLYTQSKA